MVQIAAYSGRRKISSSTLPPGLLGDPLAVPRCPSTQVTNGEGLCPADTQVGVYGGLEGGAKLLGPIVNVTPEAGQSAEFAFENTLNVDTPLLTAHWLPHGARAARGLWIRRLSNEIPDVVFTVSN